MTTTFQAFRIALCTVFLGVVSACTVPDHKLAPDEVFDPHEKFNRQIHAVNRGIDRAFFRPASKGYVTIVPAPMVTSFSQFTDNLSEPSNLVNSLLQGDGKKAGTAVARFLINSTIGFGGLADPATEFGIPARNTDFGETLYVWGVPEGAYVELPVLGPSTERDAVGTFVDIFTNPVDHVADLPKNTGTYAKIIQRMGDRGRYSDTVDSILYESADSYAQARIIYLQNRRFELAGAGRDTYVDPYEDAYIDPYEDPYAE